MSSVDADKARRAAVEIVLEYGMPLDREQLAARLAYAYALGARDGYTEATVTATQAWEELMAELEREAARK